MMAERCEGRDGGSGCEVMVECGEGQDGGSGCEAMAERCER